MKVIFQDPAFSFQLVRTIGSTYYGGADIGECLSTAYRIKEGDFESWYSEWLATAERVNKYGDNSLSAGHKVSAREASLELLIIIEMQSSFYTQIHKILE
jgi:hypothetical protein